MTPRRYELSDFEWSIIAPLLPNKPRGVPRSDDRKVLERDLLAAAHRLALGRHSGALRPPTTCYNRFVRWAEDRRVGSDFRGGVTRL